MIIGFGELAIVLLLTALTVVVCRRPRPFAPLFAGVGIGLGLYLVASVACEWSFPYQFINIYIVFFLAVIFTFAGLLGSMVWLVRRLARR